MVTARYRPVLLRTRTSTGPLRVLWLAALLLSLAYTHGASAESAETHATAATAQVHSHAQVEQDPASKAVDDSERHGDEGSSHPAEGCVAGQPPQGPDLTATCPSPLDRSAVTLNQVSPPVSDRFWNEAVVSPSSDSRSSVVQQV